MSLSLSLTLSLGLYFPYTDTHDCMTNYANITNSIVSNRLTKIYLAYYVSTDLHFGCKLLARLNSRYVTKSESVSKIVKFSIYPVATTLLRCVCVFAELSWNFSNVCICFRCARNSMPVAKHCVSIPFQIHKMSNPSWYWKSFHGKVNHKLLIDKLCGYAQDRI